MILCGQTNLPQWAQAFLAAHLAQGLPGLQSAHLVAHFAHGLPGLQSAHLVAGQEEHPAGQEAGLLEAQLVKAKQAAAIASVMNDFIVF